MDYYEIDILGEIDKSICILDGAPKGIGPKSYYMKKGKRIGEFFPADAQFFMTDEYPGIRLHSLIGNIKSYLILSKEVTDVLKKICTCEIEYLPFQLINHKKRVASTDYSIVNVIDTYDCLNPVASELKYTSDGSPIDSDKYVIDPDKMANAPHLFRTKEFPFVYVVDSVLAEIIAENKFTNINLRKLDQVPSA